MDDADAWIERGKRRRDLALVLGLCGAVAHWTAVGWLMGWE